MGPYINPSNLKRFFAVLQETQESLADAVHVIHQASRAAESTTTAMSKSASARRRSVSSLGRDRAGVDKWRSVESFVAGVSTAKSSSSARSGYEGTFLAPENVPIGNQTSINVTGAFSL